MAYDAHASPRPFPNLPQFYGTWCAGCKALAPRLVELAEGDPSVRWLVRRQGAAQAGSLPTEGAASHGGVPGMELVQRDGPVEDVPRAGRAWGLAAVLAADPEA